MAVDPRVERSRHVIRESALTELSEVGYGRFAIDSVAARAGVGRSTVYRHWSGKLDLVADALETLNEQPGPNLGGDEGPRERVERLLHHLVEVLAGSPFAGCVPALVDAAERDATVRAFHHRYSATRRHALAAAVAAGVESGDFRPTLDADLASIALAGAVFYRRLMTDDPFHPGDVHALVDTVLAR